MCKGCKLNDPNTDPNKTNIVCKFKKSKKDIKGIKFFERKRSHIKIIPHKLSALERNLKAELNSKHIHPNNFIVNSPQPYIAIDDLNTTLIHKWIISKEYKNTLLELYLNNKAKDNQETNSPYEFYTDGSLKDRSSTETAMGSAWIQTQGPQPNSTFKSSSSYWPSSSKAEAIAIFTALLTVPEKRRLKSILIAKYV
jgi:hypothetical protein